MFSACFSAFIPPVAVTTFQKLISACWRHELHWNSVGQCFFLVCLGWPWPQARWMATWRWTFGAPWPRKRGSGPGCLRCLRPICFQLRSGIPLVGSYWMVKNPHEKWREYDGNRLEHEIYGEKTREIEGHMRKSSNGMADCSLPCSSTRW